MFVQKISYCYVKGGKISDWDRFFSTLLTCWMFLKKIAFFLMGEFCVKLRQNFVKKILAARFLHQSIPSFLVEAEIKGKK